jgi:hypothetical protein
VGLIALAAMTSCTKSNTAVRESVNNELFVRTKMIEQSNVGKTFCRERSASLREADVNYRNQM